MYIILIFSALITVAVAEPPALSCLYSVSRWTNRYQCDFTINNPDGFNNFTEIGGIHLEGFTNADVEEFWIVRNVGCVSTNVPRIICDTFQNIISFDFIDLGISEIGDSDFAGCSRITELVLRYNRIATISTNAFDTLSTLWGIGLEYNNLKTLPENVFANQQDMRYLELNMNPLDNIPDLRPLENLQYLYLSHTNINEINNQWFSHMRLEELWMANSTITALPDSFLGLEELRTLILNSNAISEIPSGVFTALSNLERLDFGDNNLTELQPDSFSDLGILNILRLSGNPIEVIYEGAFRGLDNLIELNLHDCRLRQIQSYSFENLERLNLLLLSHNNISELQPDSFSGLRQLSRLFINNNPIETIHEGAFRGLDNLIELRLNDCRLRQIHSYSFENLKSLNILQLDANEIEEISEGAFGELNLQRLLLWRSRLITLHRKSFGSLTNLRWLEVHVNMVNALDRAIIDDAVNLDRFMFSGNLCANRNFFDFSVNRADLPMLQACFDNYEHIVGNVE